MLGRIRKKLSRPSSTGAKPGKSSVVEEEEPHIIGRLSIDSTDQRIISKLAFVDSDQLGPVRSIRHATPAIATKWSERTVFNNVDAGFLALPTEILLFLQPYLAESSQVSLRQSCSGFYNLFSTLPSFCLAGDDKFIFLCMLERDMDQTLLTRLVCGYCRDTHSRSAFAASELSKAPAARDCRQIWVCPHKALGFEKTIRKVKSTQDNFRAETIDPCQRCKELIRNRSVADAPENLRTNMQSNKLGPASLLISKVALLQAPSPAHATRAMAASMYTETFPAKEVSAALQAINFRICPHIHLGDPFILSKFCRACLRTTVLPPGSRGLPCISENKCRDFGETNRSAGKCRGSCYASGCKTKFMFQARESYAPDASGQRQVWLIIALYRWLGPLEDGKMDATWVSHALNANERTDMRNNWATWLKTPVRKCLPNWSICLLHPDDCNLP